MGQQPERSTAADMDEALAQAVHLEAGRVPLAEGLKAAALSAGTSALARTFEQLAARLEQGETLAEAVRALTPRVSPLAAGVLAAVEHGRGDPQLLLALVQQHEQIRRLRGSITSAIAYPLVVLVAAIAVFIGLQLTLVRGYRSLFENMALQVPLATQVLFWWSETGAWLLLALLVGLLIAIAAAWTTLGTTRWRYVLASAPLLGVIWRWSGLAQMTRLLGTLLESGLPLPQALRITQQSLGDGLSIRICQQLAEHVESGRSLTQAARQVPGLPGTIIPLLSIGERSGALAAALQASAELLEGRVRLRAAALKRIAPAVILFAILVTVAFCIVALFVPLVNLINSLT